ncbi:DUF6046 domain-containing protein [Flavobacterium sp.]|uniref:DUF6046 domain-containing protein n=1 Tax=Flavobacterium sp. TaxID=239 RepID=UPI00260B7313|nr:DUF6046 domain-containing protein [Flavobacterium sp.]
MESRIIDLNQLYQQYFNTKPYYVTPKDSVKPTTQDVNYAVSIENPRRKGSIDYSQKGIAYNKIGSYGQDIWFPIQFWKSNNKVIELEACTVAVSLNKTIIQTVVSERQGTVQERFNTDDYKFSIKGFLIGKDRFFPEDQIQILKDLWQTTEPVQLHGGYPEVFLDESCRVTILNVDFPDAQGKAMWIRPFTMSCISDFIQDLIIP